jgi:hypothetical protein
MKAQASQSVRPLDSMRRELARLMGMAGYELEWRSPEASPIDTSAFLAVVELRGDCEASPGSFPADSGLRETAELLDGRTTPLASTFISDGQVLPFSWVNCGNVTKLLAPALADEPGAEADFIFGRAVARLIAHEFYHILMQTREHTRNGISKPSLSAGDLLLEGFNFEPEALAQLWRCRAGKAPDGSSGAAVTVTAESFATVSGRSGSDR